MGDRVIRFGVDRMAIARDGAFEIAGFQQQVPKVRQRRSVRRFDAQRFFEIGARQFASLQADACDAALIDEEGAIRRTQTILREQRRERGIGAREVAPIERAQGASKRTFIPNHVSLHVHD